MNLDRFERIALLHQDDRRQVWRARDREQPDADYVLKIVNVTEPDAAHILGVEYSLARDIRQPNLTRALGFGRDGDRVWLLREFVPGKTLLEAAGSQDSASRRRLLRDMLRALSELHRHAIVHLDVKPENILIRDPDGVAVLTDFGLARSLLSRSQDRRYGGTPPFVAPEVLLGLPADPRSDLFSLAATLVSVHPAVPPIDCDRLYRRFPNDTFLDALGIAPAQLDDEIAPLLLRMLALEPSDRPRSAAEALAALDDDEVPLDQLRSLLRPAPPIPHAANEALRDLTDPARADRCVVFASASGAPADEILERARFFAVWKGLDTVDAFGLGLQASEMIRGQGLREPGDVAAARIARAGRVLEQSPTTLSIADARGSREHGEIARLALRLRRERGGATRLLLIVDASQIERDALDDEVTWVSLEPIDAEHLAAHLASLEKADGAERSVRHRELAARILDVAGHDSESIGRCLARAIDDGHAAWRHGRLWIDRLRPDQIAPPASDETQASPEQLAVLALIGLWGGAAPPDLFGRAFDGSLAPVTELLELGWVARFDGAFRATPPSRASHALSRLDRARAQNLAVASLDHAAFARLPSVQRALTHALAGDTETAHQLVLLRDPLERVDATVIARLADAVRDDAGAACDVALLRSHQCVRRGDLDGAAAVLDGQLLRDDLGVDRLVDMLIERGEIDLHRTRFDEAEEFLGRARKQLTRLPSGDPQRFLVWRGLSYLRVVRGDPQGAADLLWSARRSWRGERGLHYDWLSVLYASFLARTGAASRARDTLTDTVSRLRQATGDPTLQRHLLAVALGNLGPILLRTGDPHAAIDALTEARDLRLRAQRPLEEAMILNNSAIVYRELADVAAAIESAREATRVYGWCGDALGEASARANLGDLLRRCGRLGEAERELVAAWTVVEERCLPRERLLVGCRLARLHLAKGDIEEAARVFAALEAGVDERVPDRERAEIALTAAEIAAAREDFERALAKGLQARDGFGRCEDQPSIALAELRVGEWALKQRSPERAAEHFSLCRRIGTPLLMPDLQLQEGLLSAYRGAREEAYARLLQARDAARAADQPALRSMAAAAIARLLADVDRSRALAFAREADAAVDAIEFGAETKLDRDERRRVVLGRGLADGLAMSSDEPTEGRATQRGGDVTGDAVPLEMFRSVAAICRSLSRERDLDRLLQRLVDHAVAITGARRGFLLIQRDGTLKVEKTHGDEDGERATFSRSIAQDAIRQRRPIVCANANEDERFLGRRSIEELDLRSVLCAPFVCDDGLVGVIYVDNRVREGIFSPRSIDFLEVVADQAAVAISNLARRRDAPVERARQPVPAEPSEPSRPVESAALIGESPAWRQTLDLVQRMAASDIPLLVLGESGTGKELIARDAHRRSPRAERPFVAVNVSAVPETLMEAEFFGYVKGAFTGADRDHEGFFAQADRGTLFLDEIGDMPAAMQVKLLRALQDGQIRPVGSIAPTASNVRLICATHRDLSQMVESGTFRQDLYFRIRGAIVEVPPLRRRPGDAILLAEHFLAEWNEQHGGGKRLSPRVKRQIEEYAWPGNVRELINEIRRLCVVSEGDQIDGPIIREHSRQAANGKPTLALKPMKEIEKDAILLALTQCDGNRERAARLLEIPRTTFYNKLKRLGVPRSGEGPSDRPESE